MKILRQLIKFVFVVAVILMASTFALGLGQRPLAGITGEAFLYSGAVLAILFSIYVIMFFSDKELRTQYFRQLEKAS